MNSYRDPSAAIAAREERERQEAFAAQLEKAKIDTTRDVRHFVADRIREAAKPFRAASSDTILRAADVADMLEKMAMTIRGA